MKKLLILLLFLYSIKSYSNCDLPQALFTNNITFSNAQANWSPVSGAYKYTLKYRICGTLNWSSLQIFAPDSTRNLPTLQAATCYEWTLKAFCDSTNNQINSGWSDTINFTTITFIYAPFNPIIFNYIDTNYCDLHTSLSLNMSQLTNEPDIGESTITSDGGYFDISSLSISDSIGFAVLHTSSQTINSVLRVGFIAGQNYALINSYDSTGNLIGFFSIENELTGIKISSTSPNDGNDYTSGFTSEIYFDNLFVTPNYDGPLHFYVDIESELNDQFYDTASIIIFCNSTSVKEHHAPKTLECIYDIFGRKSNALQNNILFYHFSDGTIEKKLIIKN